LSASIEDLIDAGVTSFKIEGRLKDADYVTNVVAYYRQIIDKVIASRKDLVRASEGVQFFGFDPQLNKTFNRGFTSYFLNGRSKEILSPLTPKSTGEKLGTIKELGKSWIRLNRQVELRAGDGLCFFIGDELIGTNVNNYDDGKIYLNEMSGVRVGQEIYRNFSVEFEKIIKSKKAAQRFIVLNFVLNEVRNGFVLSACDQSGVSAEVKIKQEKILAKNLSTAAEIAKKQIGKLGDTGYIAGKIECRWKQPYILSLAVLNQMRRDLIEKITVNREKNFVRAEVEIAPSEIVYPEKDLNYLGNVSNKLAKRFYARHGVVNIGQAFELERDYRGKKIMTTKHCLRFFEGMCPKNSGKKQKGNMYLVNGKNKYRLEFDCAKCAMSVWLD